MLTKFIGIFLIFTISVSANFSDITFGTGVINEQIGRYQINRDGDKNNFDHRVYFNSSVQYNLMEGWSLIPEVGLLWPFGTTDDENTQKYSYFFNTHIGYSFLENWMITLGTGMYLTSIKGDGGSATLPNGDGFTSFPVPDGITTTRNVVAILGGQFYFYDHEWSVKSQVFAFNVANSRNRSFSYTLSFNYHFGDTLWN